MSDFDYIDEEWLPKIPKGLERLSPNPGGVVDPIHLVGRQSELDQLIKAVTIGDGAHVTGERRMGKTSLVKKLKDELESTCTAIYVSAETSSLEKFTQRLLRELRANKRVGEVISRWEAELGGEIELKFGPLGKLMLSGKLSRSSTKTDTGERDVLDLLESENIVLIIDEITHLCHKLGPENAQEFLGNLRSQRQSGGLPLVISGSIGLHHTLSDLTPVNDLWTVTVRSLPPDHAAELAARLLLGIAQKPTPQLVADIVRQTSGIPYYIHGVVKELENHAEQDIDSIINQALSMNVWHTDHYDTRLDEYYGETGAQRARIILDLVSTSDSLVDIEAIESRITIEDKSLKISRTDLVALLRKMEKDHYLERTDNSYRISSAFLSRIWRNLRLL